ncbi:hypothetical protein MIR68_002477 [Amoeboaphelidium protococcarum]|nr:hypothetical protein MIR68_002477 [Amoeboaphelidium protococcarum]KAI3654947.1 hypothetical protein MP228_000327 [Amoeboaphelidium protococcarum]
MEAPQISVPLRAMLMPSEYKQSLSKHGDVFIKAGYMSDDTCGTAYVEYLGIKVAASVYGPHHRPWSRSASNFSEGSYYAIEDTSVIPHSSRAGDQQKYSQDGVAVCKFNVDVQIAPFAHVDRSLSGNSEYSRTVASIVQKALVPSIMLHRYPKASIDLNIQVLQFMPDDVGSNLFQDFTLLLNLITSLAIVAGSCALSDAEVKLYDLVVASLSLTTSSLGSVVSSDISQLAQFNQGSNITVNSQLMFASMPSLQRVTNCVYRSKNASDNSPSTYNDLMECALERIQQVYEILKSAVKAASMKKKKLQEI